MTEPQAISTWPKISVVTIALNAARDLPLTIESAIGQDYGALETMLIDGQSWDGSAEILRRYRPLVDSVIIREDAGIYPAMNAALDEVSGDYVIFLNAGDQFFGADAVSRMVRGLRGRPDVFYGNHVYVTGRYEAFKRSASFDWLAGKLIGGAIEPSWHGAIPGHQATFTSVPLLRRLRYDTRLRVAADHDFLFRAHAAGADMLYVDETVAHYHAGGFSAVVGELIRTEWTSIYRRFSDNPALVDRYFYPNGAPFLPITARTGFRLTGFLPARAIGDLPAGEEIDWVAGKGCKLAAPARESFGLALSGANRIAGQTVEIMCNDGVIGSVELPQAGFRVEVAFNSPVAAGAVVTLRPSRSVAIGDETTAAFALRSSRFLTEVVRCKDYLKPGETFHTRNDAGQALADTLGMGWSAPENALIWSVGRESDLWLGLDDDVRSLAVDLSGNPHVDGGVQQVRLVVNGQHIDDIRLENGERRTMRYDAGGGPWQPGKLNHIQFFLDHSSTPPASTGDTRDLGIALWSMKSG